MMVNYELGRVIHEDRQRETQEWLIHRGLPLNTDRAFMTARRRALTTVRKWVASIYVREARARSLDTPARGRSR